MSRERARKRVPGFFRYGDKRWDPIASRAVGPRAYIIYGETPYAPSRIDVNSIEIGARNRSGERRRTGKTLKDI